LGNSLKGQKNRNVQNEKHTKYKKHTLINSPLGIYMIIESVEGFIIIMMAYWPKKKEKGQRKKK